MTTGVSTPLKMSLKSRNLWKETGRNGEEATSTGQILPHWSEILDGAYVGADAVQGVERNIVFEIDDISFGKMDWGQAIFFIRNINVETHRSAKSCLPRNIQWASNPVFYQTDVDFVPVFNTLDEETEEFVNEHDLANSVAWLQSTIPYFFDGADFEITLLPTDDGEDSLLALKVYGGFNSSEFRKRMHQICKAMLSDDHRGLYDIISIFQRRVKGSGWKAFSYYTVYG